MNQETKERLQELCNTITEAVSEAGRIIKDENSHLYEQWKASGKQVTDEFVSMYPSLPEILERFDNIDDEQEEDDCYTAREPERSGPF